MSTPAGEYGGLVIVVDSSIEMSTALPRVIQGYLPQFMYKLAESNQYRVGWVTYGQANYPVHARRFFAELSTVIAALKNPLELQNLGIGLTTKGGTRGMAALEGLVAAIELFDTLAESSKAPRRWPSHILHITASFPDESKHPRSNHYPALDDTTWETLPDELAKRNLHLSSIVLSPKKNKNVIADLHSNPALNTAPTSWINVLPPHVAYVPVLNAGSLKGVKRPADPMNAVELPPEKRHQLNSPSAGSPPRPQTTPTSTFTQTTPTAGQIQQQPAQPAQPGNGTSAQPSVPVPPTQVTSGMPNPLPLPFPVPPPNSTQKFSWPGIGLFTPQELIQRFQKLEETKRRADVLAVNAAKELKELREHAEKTGENKETEIARATQKLEHIKAEMMKMMTPSWVKLRMVGQGYINMIRKMSAAGGKTANGAGPSGAPGQIQSSTLAGDSTMTDKTSSNNNPNPPSTNGLTSGGPSSSSPVPVTKLEPKPSPSLSAAVAAVVKQSPKSSPQLTNKSNPAKSSPKSTPKPNPKYSPAKNNATGGRGGSASPMNNTVMATSVAPGPSGPITGSAPPNINLSSDVALQMKKLMEQSRGGQHSRDMARGQGSPNLAAATVGGVPSSGPSHASPQAQQSAGAMHMQDSNAANIGMGIPGQQGAGNATELSAPNQTQLGVPQNPGISGPIPAWTGQLFLPGEGGRKDLKTVVLAMSANHVECRAHTWPTEMTLTITNHPVVNPTDFTFWAKKTRPVVCTFKAHSRSLPPGTSVSPQIQMGVNQFNAVNEQLLKAFTGLVGNGKNYIVSSWTLPSGAQTNNVVFALQPPHGLIGAFFPVSGIPEMPKPTPAGAVPGPGLGGNISAAAQSVMTVLRGMNAPPEVVTKIVALPPELQIQAVKQLLGKQQALSMRAGQGQPGGMGGNPGAAGLGMAGMGGRPRPGGPGSGVNITTAAAAMALRMAQQQPGAPGGSTGGGAMGMPLGLQNLQGVQRTGQMDGNQQHLQQSNNPNMASLMSANLGNANLGNLGGMGGMNAASLSGIGGGGMTLQQIQQFQQLQNRGAFGGPGSGGMGQGGGGMR